MGFFDHCPPNWRFTSFNAERNRRGPTKWQTIDWDQRRYISTSVPDYVGIPDFEGVGESTIQALAKIVDRLDNDVNLVNFSMKGDLISTSSDPIDNTASMPLYYPIDLIPKDTRTGRVILRKDLVELDRLSRRCDLVRYRFQPRSRGPGVFKYNFHREYARTNCQWHEINCWLGLSEHPNIVPFEYIVTDFEDVPGHGTNIEVVVGFTSTFIPGKTLGERTSRTFKLKYLEQLIKVVDDLNLKFGIVHQNIAPQNLLIDPTTDTLQLFNFSYSGRLDWEDDEGEFANFGSFNSDLNKVVATVYVIITGDRERAIGTLVFGGGTSDIMRKKWVKKPNLSLDSDISSYQRILRCWLRRRNRPHNLITHFTQAQSPLEWPQPWKPEIPALDRDGNPSTLWNGQRSTSSVQRSTLRAMGLKSVEWKRPAHNKIPEGFCVLADGTLVAQAELDEDAQGQVVGSRYAGPQTNIEPGTREPARAD